MNKLGNPQRIMFATYVDCKERTKKNIEFPKESKGMSHDEELVYFMLENSSITECTSERSFRRVREAIDVMCRQLCPGQWCTRSHCRHYGSGFAYKCSKTRPSVCKEYKDYIENKKLREEKEKDANHESL